MARTHDGLMPCLPVWSAGVGLPVGHREAKSLAMIAQDAIAEEIVVH